MRLHVFSDFDGTISRPDTLQFLTKRFGGGEDHWTESGRLLASGAVQPRDIIARDVGSIRTALADVRELLRAGVEIDPGFPAFARWCDERRVPLTILSAGFEEIIRLLLPREQFPRTEVLANTLEPGTWRCVFRDGSPFGHDKSAAVRAARADGRYAVYVGDGISDEEPAAAADFVFARRGESLAKFCRAQRIAHAEFETFDEVRRELSVRLDRL